MRRLILAGSAMSFLVVGLAAGAFAAPGDPPPTEKSAVDQKAEFDAVKTEYDKANQDFMTAYRASKTDEERTAALAKRPNPDDYVARMTAIADKDKKSSSAAECFAWIVQSSRKPDAQAAALDALLADHLASPVIARMVGSLTYSSAKNRDAFLQAVLDKSTDRDAQGRACYVLGSTAASRGRAADADRYLALVVEKFGDVKYGGSRLDEKAKRDLFELHDLAVGKPAPDVVGADVDGKPMKLSDFRGKVVVLDFFGFW
jgi:hypothetical protein